VGPVALTCVCVSESGLSTTIRVSLIVAPDNNLHHKSGYQIDLQCFLRFLLAILKQLSFCSVGTLDMAERSKEDNKPI